MRGGLVSLYTEGNMVCYDCGHRLSGECQVQHCDVYLAWCHKHQYAMPYPKSIHDLWLEEGKEVIWDERNIRIGMG